MKRYFEDFINEISLSAENFDDARTKYKGVCTVLCKEFYNSKYIDSKKFLFGSYRKVTTLDNWNKDVDIIFRISKEDFEKYSQQNYWPSNLLTRIKNVLKERYSTTNEIKNWTKIVRIWFQSFAIELLPWYEKEDGTFMIPNTWEWDDWEEFNPREEIKSFYDSNRETSGITRKVIKLIKAWKYNTIWVKIKSYVIDNYIIDFLDEYEFKDYQNFLVDFFEFLFSNENSSYIETALNRAKKWLDFYNDWKIELALQEYIKIFWDKFPAQIHKSANSLKFTEQFIEDFYPLVINKMYNLELDCRVEQNGFRIESISKIPILKKKSSLQFFIKSTNVPYPFSVKWKVKNFWEEAHACWQGRWEITDDDGSFSKKERARYLWEHYVECYIIKNWICVVRKRISVPIDKF